MVMNSLANRDDKRSAPCDAGTFEDEERLNEVLARVGRCLDLGGPNSVLKRASELAALRGVAASVHDLPVH